MSLDIPLKAVDAVAERMYTKMVADAGTSAAVAYASLPAHVIHHLRNNALTMIFPALGHLHQAWLAQMMGAGDIEVQRGWMSLKDGQITPLAADETPSGAGMLVQRNASYGPWNTVG